VVRGYDLPRTPDIAKTWAPTSGVGFWVHLTYQESAFQFRRSRQFSGQRLQIHDVIQGKGRQNEMKCRTLKGKLQTIGEHEAVTDCAFSSGNAEHGCRKIDSNHRARSPSQKTGEPSSRTAPQVQNIACGEIPKNARQMAFLQCQEWVRSFVIYSCPAIIALLH